MDKRIRKYVLYKVRTLEDRKKELRGLLQKREEMRRNLIDSTSGAMDGQPRGKGQVGNPTEQKALKLVDIDRRISKLQEELNVVARFEASVTGMQREIYIETIKKNCTDLTAKAQLLHMGRRQLIEKRGKILRYLATEMGEYLDNEK